MGKQEFKFIFSAVIFTICLKTTASFALTCGSALDVKKTFAYSQWEDFQTVDISEIVSLKKYIPRYRGYKANIIETGLLDGRRVFVKTYPKFKNELEVLAKVVSFNVLVSRLGFGAKFLGVGINSNGEPYTVNEFARGRFFRFNQMQWPYLLDTQKPIKNLTKAIRKLFNDLSEEGIVVGDFQMFVHEDGSMHVVDTDEFGLLDSERAHEYNHKTFELIKSYLSKFY